MNFFSVSFRGEPKGIFRSWQEAKNFADENGYKYENGNYGIAEY